MKILKKILASLDVGIYRISKNKSFPGFIDHSKDFDIKIDPIIHNSKEYLNTAVTTKGIKAYLSDERIEFYNRIVKFCVRNNIKFEGKTILDCGCSCSKLLDIINEEFKPQNVTGYDFSSKTIEIARILYPKIKFRNFDLVKNKPDEKFDVVFCTQVLEHISQPEAALNNLINLTKARGAILITVPDGRLDNYRGHINFWSRESFECFIERCLIGNNANVTFGVELGGINCIILLQ